MLKRFVRFVASELLKIVKNPKRTAAAASLNQILYPHSSGVEMEETQASLGLKHWMGAKT